MGNILNRWWEQFGKRIAREPLYTAPQRGILDVFKEWWDNPTTSLGDKNEALSITGISPHEAMGLALIKWRALPFLVRDQMLDKAEMMLKGKQM